MIAVVDSGVANLASVMAALRRLGAEAEVTADAETIRKAERVILPGVGAAAAAMAQLRQKNLIETLRGLTQPMLGICLGMQLLFERSEEGENTPCLGVLPGTVAILPASPATPVPHMGWNQLNVCAKVHPLLRGVAEGSYAYFVHSFAVPVTPLTIASANYGTDFTAVAARGNFMGCQFHPERSGEVGSLILRNFLGV
jgi:glutamine amidotransferase